MSDEKQKDFQKMVHKYLARIDREIEEAVVETIKDRGMVEAIHEIVTVGDGTAQIVKTDEVRAARAGCALLRMLLRRRLLERAQEHWPDGEIDFSQVDWSMVGKW